MTKFEYREVDKEGWETLDAIAGADKFNEWMYKTIRPYCSGRILEIGSGIGNISRYFLNEKANITLSDIRPIYCDILSKEFPQAQAVITLDLTHPQFDSAYNQHLSAYDTVFALNVVEHIEDDNLALRNCHKLLRPGGRVVILVPAYSWLYNRFDKELEHFRRYNRRGLNLKISAAGFSVVHSQYFNLMGIPGWYVSGKLQKNKTIPKSQMSLYNKLVPAFKLIDCLVINSIGLSVISVGIK
jgi:2-polyprenyl-3-methyl-5-hydroxy-6-metoxy-1,4-benzoquinol methylase